MLPTKKFLEDTIKACRSEKEKHRINFERQDAVEKFCEYLINKGIFVEEVAKGEKDGVNGVVDKETAGRRE